MSAVAVAAGAFGAHGLKPRLDARALELWDLAVRYLMYGGLGVVLVGLAAEVWPQRNFAGSGWCLLAGALAFAGTVAAMALGGPRWLGAITPLGGALMIVGFLLFAWVSVRA